jgi:putative transposase
VPDSCDITTDRSHFGSVRQNTETHAVFWSKDVLRVLRRIGIRLRLGIGIERIAPGHPQQNGRHERMHLTLKKEATKPAAANFLQQQARFDKFIEVFNNERPHEALDMKCPAEVYQPSPRPYTGLPDIDYPLHDKTIVVTRCGRICLGKKKINFSQVFAGQAVGIKEVHDDIWLLSFMDYDLGYFDLETRVLEPLENPFGPKVLPMS